jgi:molecular chaperone HtpG
VVNTNNPLTVNILEEKKEESRDKVVKQLYDLAMLSQNLLRGERLTQFISRSIDIIKKQ